MSSKSELIAVRLPLELIEKIKFYGLDKYPKDDTFDKTKTIIDLIEKGLNSQSTNNVIQNVNTDVIQDVIQDVNGSNNTNLELLIEEKLQSLNLQENITNAIIQNEIKPLKNEMINNDALNMIAHYQIQKAIGLEGLDECKWLINPNFKEAKKEINEMYQDNNLSQSIDTLLNEISSLKLKVSHLESEKESVNSNHNSNQELTAKEVTNSLFQSKDNNNLEAKTVTELRAIAQNLKIKNPKQYKKDELIEKIKEV